ncbi:hypothetical protein GCM10025867_35650 [Frondihabitans sucicola]|uniref:Alanine racemase C-terminal domain-containing protein n=1 Tax=Frondihabitans sucicola TaxID=1268041 RepID=A0ABM8GS60_9MICO|nr:hypothetical protein GCM10025867_35650 [Frondihabitans sucicola]
MRGRRVPVVGAMSMNALVVDLGPVGPGDPGEEVTVFGGSTAVAPTVGDWAAWAGTLPQDVVTAVGRALPRHVVGASSVRDGRAAERRSA